MCGKGGGREEGVGEAAWWGVLEVLLRLSGDCDITEVNCGRGVFGLDDDDDGGVGSRLVYVPEGGAVVDWEVEDDNGAKKDAKEG